MHSKTSFFRSWGFAQSSPASLFENKFSTGTLARQFSVPSEIFRNSFYCHLLFNYQCSFCCLATAYLDYHIQTHLSTTFFNFFKLFFRLVYAFFERFVILTQAFLFVNTFFIYFLFYFKHSLNESETSYIFHLSMQLHIRIPPLVLPSDSQSQTQRVGFEPTCPFGQTVFKTASL